jgi:GAF domain-containing protein
VSEGILLAKVARGTLLPEADRLARLDEAMPQIRAAVEGELEEVALQATLACLLWEALPQTNWCGFYRRVEARALAVGPYQGGMGCLRIAFERGVCGAAARSGETQLVADVQAFPGHIACDDATRSELVIPILDGSGLLRGVLDLDSPHLDAFSRGEAAKLEALLAEIFRGPVAWAAWGQ